MLVGAGAGWRLCWLGLLLVGAVLVGACGGCWPLGACCFVLFCLSQRQRVLKVRYLIRSLASVCRVDGEHSPWQKKFGKSKFGTTLDHSQKAEKVSSSLFGEALWFRMPGPTHVPWL